MRALTVALLFSITLNAFGQGIPQLPYNPDENGDGLIGVPDLQALLAQYGLEFNSAVLSEDAQSAIVYMGEMAHPVCNLACDNLPGFWHMSTLADLGLVWDEVVSSNATTWVKADHQSQTDHTIAYIYNQKYYSTNDAGQPSYDCYCAAHELPKVEYKIVTDAEDPYLTTLGSQGWKLLNVGYMDNNSDVTGVMWRWAVE